MSAIDVDPVAVDVAEQNARANGVSIQVSVADGLAGALPKVGIAVANLTLDAVRELAPRLRASRFVSSGYLVEDDPSLSPWTRSARREADGWAADLWR